MVLVVIFSQLNMINNNRIGNDFLEMFRLIQLFQGMMTYFELIPFAGVKYHFGIP